MPTTPSSRRQRTRHAPADITPAYLAFRVRPTGGLCTSNVRQQPTASCEGHYKACDTMTVRDRAQFMRGAGRIRAPTMLPRE